VNGVKVGHLIAEPVDHEFAPGCAPSAGATTAARRGRPSRPSRATACASTSPTACPSRPPCTGTASSCPNGMDGVAGLTQRPIPPGETFVYEFTLRHPGTFMYHPHYDEMTQIALGMTGMFIVHPRARAAARRPRLRADDARVEARRRRAPPRPERDERLQRPHLQQQGVPRAPRRWWSARRARAHPPRQPQARWTTTRSTSTGSLQGHGDRRRLRPRVGAAPRHHRARAGGQHARDRVRPRGARRLGHALPHDPPRDDADGPRLPPMVGADTRSSTAAWPRRCPTT
jgi:FtsP/CotA-like multicopper oxidase with cupredoxin domain